PLGAVATLGVAGAAAGGVYLWGYKTPGWHQPSPAAQHSVFAVLSYTGRFLGIPVQGLGPMPAALAGLAGVFAWAWPALCAVRRRRTMPAAVIAGVSLMVVLIATAGLTALGRAHMPGANELPSRYGTPALLFWAMAFLI